MGASGGDPDALLALGGRWGDELLAIDRTRTDVEDAHQALREGSDAWRLPLDPGLTAEVDTLVDGWRATDDLVGAVGRTLRDGDLAAALRLATASVVAHLAAATTVHGDALATELRFAVGTPAGTAAWWDGLSAAERAAFEAHAPEVLGRTEGIPLDVRDRVNRVALAAELARLRAEVDADAWHERNLGIPFVADGWRDGHEADLARIAALEALQEADLLLLFATEGDGRAVAAWGDPATAEHVATFVPGISNHLGNVGGPLGDARRLRDAAVLERSGSVATVAWLGYDTPGSVGNHTHEVLTEATHDGRARRGATALEHFADGLRAVRADDGHLTVVGHSYGSVVLGAALRDGGLGVDEAVAIGSPGMGVDHASELDMAPGTTLWAASAGTHEWTWVLPGGGDDPVAHAPAHGANPADPGFGAQGFDVGGASGHSAYLAGDTTSLTSIARIVVGIEPARSPHAPVELAPGPFGVPATGGTTL